MHKKEWSTPIFKNTSLDGAVLDKLHFHYFERERQKLRKSKESMLYHVNTARQIGF